MLKAKRQNMLIIEKGNRAISNKLDRFGRVAFNKQRELSQASFEIGSSKSDRDSKSPRELSPAMGRVLQTDKADVFMALQKRR